MHRSGRPARIPLRCLAPAALAFALAACSAPAAASTSTPDSTVEGALRASLAATVAPSGYTSGLLEATAGQAWLANAKSDLAKWYSPGLVDEHMTGVGNLVQSLETTPGPIIESATVTSVSPGQVAVDGLDATATDASIHYRLAYGGADIGSPASDGVTMCRMTLHKAGDGWSVIDETCDVSGG